MIGGQLTSELTVLVATSLNVFVHIVAGC